MFWVWIGISNHVPKVDYIIDVFCKYQARYSLCDKHLETVLDGIKTWTMDCIKAYIKIFVWYHGPLFEIFFEWWDETIGIYGLWMGREWKWQEEYIRCMFQFGLCYDILDEKKVDLCCTQYCGSRVCFYLFGMLWGSMASNAIL